MSAQAVRPRPDPQHDMLRPFPSLEHPDPTAHLLRLTLYQLASVVTFVALGALGGFSLLVLWTSVTHPLAIGLVTPGIAALTGKLYQWLWAPLQAKVGHHWTAMRFEREVEDQISRMMDEHSNGRWAELEVRSFLFNNGVTEILEAAPRAPLHWTTYLPGIARCRVHERKAMVLRQQIRTDLNQPPPSDPANASAHYALIAERFITRWEQDGFPHLLHAAVLLENMRHPFEASTTLETLGEITSLPVQHRLACSVFPQESPGFAALDPYFRFRDPARGYLHVGALNQAMRAGNPVREVHRLLYPRPGG